MATASLPPVRRFAIDIFDERGVEGQRLIHDRFTAHDEVQAWQIATSQYPTKPGWMLILSQHDRAFGGYLRIRDEVLS